MALAAFILLLSCLLVDSAGGRLLPKSASNPVFGPRQVYGLLDGSVTVKCFYPPTRTNRHDRKYWCRESAKGCITIVSTSGYTATGYQGKVSIVDDPQAESFQINLTQLTLGDAGTYQCGVGINGRGLSFKVSLDVSEGPHVPEGAKLFYVKLHSTLIMSCSFGEENESKRKFLCKMDKNGCHNIINSYGEVDEDYKGRVLLSNEATAGSFSITITRTDWEDAGLYLCGVGTYGEDGETKELDVHVYQETKVPQAKPTVFGVKGSSATFECRYGPQRGSSLKYWCKWRESGCARIIDTSGYVSPAYEGRVAMYDSPGNQNISIILNQLKDTDKGYYWCMTDEVKEQQSSVELKIVDGEPALQGEKTVEAQAGSRVDLTCSYPCKYYSYDKYWCKWSSPNCIPMPASDQGQSGPGVTCDSDNKTVILSFDPVAKTDEGWYWCGVKRNGQFGETMAVYLQVMAGELQGRGRQGHADQGVDTPNHPKLSFIPQGRASGDAEVRSAAGSESSDESQGPNTLALVLGPVGGVLLVLATAFAIFKYRQLKGSDLVSIGSYRTNISMSDFESVKGYSASNTICEKETQETQIGGDAEFITTKAPPASTAEAKKAKRSSKEDADLAYSAFLLASSSIPQASTEGHSAAPAVSPPDREGQI
ncbi:PIGR protein, partial [Pterocles burchelli]|nr:PIGR protein [Pterocles burchelli]